MTTADVSTATAQASWRSIVRSIATTTIKLTAATLVAFAVVLLAAELVLRLIGGEPTVLGHLGLSQLPPQYVAWYQVTKTIDGAEFVMRAPYTYTALRPSTSADPPGIHQDSLGLRGAEITRAKATDAFRVIVVGGSVAWGMDATSDDRTLWGVLRGELQKAYPERHIEVVSAATSGWNSTQEMLDLRLRLLDLQPDLVVVFDGFNDFSQPLSGYVDDAPEGFREFMELSTYAIDHPLHYWFDTTLNDFILHSHSRLLNKLVVRSPALVVHNLAAEPQTPRWDNSDELLGPIIERYLGNLAAMTQMTRERGIGILLVTQPDLYVARTPLGPEREVVDGGEAARLAAERFHREVADRAPSLVDNHTSWYRDYTTIFEDFDEPTYWDSVHPVENGHQVIGEALFQDVKQLGLVSGS